MVELEMYWDEDRFHGDNFEFLLITPSLNIEKNCCTFVYVYCLQHVHVPSRLYIDLDEFGANWKRSHREGHNPSTSHDTSEK